jgi:hypothetical protein
MDELARDYREMHPMFLTEPPPFENVVKELRSLEVRLNQPEREVVG